MEKKGYGVGIVKIGMGMGMGIGMGIARTGPYPFYQCLPRTHLIPAPYKAHTRLFKILICYLYLYILLVVLSCMIFQTLTEDFI